jgi:septum site-determining protein MinC
VLNNIFEVIEIRGVTLPVISIRIKEKVSLSALKEALAAKVKGNLFKGSYFIIENPEKVPKSWIKEIEKSLRAESLSSINGAAVHEEGDKDFERLLIVHRHLRSGQKIEHGGDVLILGDVNRDAEVVAVGNIIVMGTLRGIAIAGALGDESAVVVAQKMEPQQIRIGKRIAITQEDERKSPGYPEVAKVEDGMIVLERI